MVERTQINPHVWNHVARMYRHCYNSDRKVFLALKSLGLKTDIQGVTSENLADFCLDIPLEDAFKILKDVLEIPDFWPDDNDNAELRNYSRIQNSLYSSIQSQILPFSEPPPEPVLKPEKLLGQQLVALLEQK